MLFPFVSLNFFRCLKHGGMLIIVEVVSRLTKSQKDFSKIIESMGFKSISKSQDSDPTTKEFFFELKFVKRQKMNIDVEIIDANILQPCLYKRR